MISHRLRLEGGFDDLLCRHGVYRLTDVLGQKSELGCNKSCPVSRNQLELFESQPRATQQRHPVGCIRKSNTHVMSQLIHDDKTRRNNGNHTQMLFIASCSIVQFHVSCTSRAHFSPIFVFCSLPPGSEVWLRSSGWHIMKPSMVYPSIAHNFFIVHP